MIPPTQRGAGTYRQQQAPPPSPLAIRTKKYQLDPNEYTKMAMAQVWRREWWYAAVAFGVGLLPAVFVHSWWMLVPAVLLAVLFVVVRSALITGVAQAAESKPLFERMSYEFEPRQIVLRQSEQKAAGLPWEQLARVGQEGGAYLLYLRPAAPPAEVAAWRRWVARTFDVPVFLHLPSRLFNSDTDRKRFEALLRGKGLLPAAEPVATK